MNYIVRLLTGFILLTLVSCTKDFLNLSPISNANVDNFFNTENDFDLAVVGAYTSLRSSGVFHDYMQLIGDMHSDNSTVGTTAGARTAFFEMSEFRDQPTSGIGASVWDDNYEGIARCNIVLDKIVPFSFEDEAKKNQFIGEVRFLRALFYFNLVRVFGDIPLILNEMKNIDLAYGIGRTPVNEVYEAMEADLIFASQNLPSFYTGTNVGRATSGASKGILGKIYLTQKKYAEAVQILKEVITSGQYQLLSNFNDLWKTDNKNNKESLFEVQFKKQAGMGTGSNYSARYTPYLSGVELIGVATTEGGYNIPTEDLMNDFSSLDLRKVSTIAEGYTDQAGNYTSGLSGRHTKKFLGSYTNGQAAEDNWPLLRYADVLLMYAEALNEISFQPTGEAFTYLNQVRNRAGLASLGASSADDLNIPNQLAFRVAIEKERRLELAFEGHRWFDLVRTGRALNVLQSKGYAIQEYQLLFPVPQQQIDINPKIIKQNLGYN